MGKIKPKTPKPAKLANSTLDNYVHQALQKYVRRATKYEAAVLADRDPEDLHQMRVGMRRLRTAVQTFEPAVYLPAAASEPRIGKVARQLGRLRDLDVLRETLERDFLPNLPVPERVTLALVLKQLSEERRRVFKQVKILLNGEKYRALKRSLEDWLNHPDYRAIADQPIQAVLPDLVLPLLCQLWVHPGWPIGATAGQPQSLADLSPSEEETLHSLRRQVKRVRYQLDLCKDWYGETLTEELANFGTLQEALGTIQDSFVLTVWLETKLGQDLHSRLPTMATLLSQSRDRAWQQWQPLQAHFLDLKVRRALQQAILQ
jgi:CHAD domain-containing protein